MCSVGRACMWDVLFYILAELLVCVHVVCVCVMVLDIPVTMNIRGKGHRGGLELMILGNVFKMLSCF